MERHSQLSNASGAFIEDLYQQFLEDPQAVDLGWRRFFEGYEFATRSGGRGRVDIEVAVMKLINAYRDRGHFIAKTNPVRNRRYHKADLDLEYFGLCDADLEIELEVGRQIRIGRATLRDIIAHLQKTYCGPIGTEYRYIQDSRVRMWLHERMESTANNPNLSVEERRKVLKKLAEAVGFEKFLHVKYVGQKRFSLEGCESFVPAIDTVIEHAARHSVKHIVMGMAHRGRLNVLVNLFGKTYENMFSEFEGSVLPDHVHGDGDVKYHQGNSSDYVTEDGHEVLLTLVPNPSHLEAVDPVIHGLCRAKGRKKFDGDFNRILPIVVHGDAAISGQGIVYECANMAKLDGYSTGGTIHIVINNQVGFTANYRETRSSLYCTDIAKVMESPVFHVNGDDPEACVHAAKMAVELRQAFGIDVYIDILCYRRYGHNEGDDPNFTQPLLYRSIKGHPNVLDIYVDRLIDEGAITQTEADGVTKDFNSMLQQSFQSARENKPDIHVSYLQREWSKFRQAKPEDFEESPETGVSKRRLDRGIKAMTSIPDGFTIYPKMQRLFKARQKAWSEDKLISWDLGELLAYGSLLTEKHPVRISGQDARRGTFAHRHAVLVDANDEMLYTPLNHITKTQARLSIYNSHLSEYGVLGFEYGYSLSMPNGLTIWEAQFGDFANGAQIMIDQFISSAESKWQRMSGLVMLLPHGYEGQGPEHSNARLVRFLQLCAEYNMIVCNPTTPANMFHLLRRQIKQPFRKPLVVMTPKSLLRHPEARSEVKELTEGRFREVIDDAVADPKKVKRVLLCTGKVYYELEERRRTENIENVAVVRVEQLYPWAPRQDKALAKRYSKAKDWVWVQEEPANMGAWDMMRDRYAEIAPNLHRVSRREAASPATGSLLRHRQVQQRVIAEAFADL
jgi:2-oxoglutarate dehydrogenase E1 component